MANGKKSRFDMTQVKFARFLEEGRGQGGGAAYRPWLQINDISSKGRSHRTASDRTGFRTHHLLSDNEFYAYLDAWWRTDVLDIREQYPLLPLKLTVGIAAELEVRHPRNYRERLYIPQTTDLVLVTKTGLEPIAVKEDADHEVPRTREKLAIQEEFWRRRGFQMKLVLSSQLKTQRSLNILWIYHCRRGPSDKPYIPGEDPLYDYLVKRVTDGVTSSVELARHADEQLYLQLGRALTAIRELLAQRVLDTNVDQGDISKGCNLYLGELWK